MIPINLIGVLLIKEVTSYCVAVSISFVIRRDLRFTDIADCPWAARMESTAVGNIRGVRYVTLKDDPAFLICCSAGYCREECFCVWVVWCRENVIYRSGFDDFTEIHHCDSVRNVLNNLQVVANDEVCKTEVFL